MTDLLTHPEPAEPRLSRQPKPQKQGSPDGFQTPASALLPLLPYLRPEWTIWEPERQVAPEVRQYTLPFPLVAAP